MMYIEQSELEEAFVTMMNKLIFSQKQLLKPFVEELRGANGKANIQRVQELEQRLEKNKEQEKVLANLMTSGYLDTALITRIRNEIQTEYDFIQSEKSAIAERIHGSLAHVKEAQQLLRFAEKADELVTFEESIFLDYVNEIRVLSRNEIEFRLKCGLKIKERLVRK